MSDRPGFAQLRVSLEPLARDRDPFPRGFGPWLRKSNRFDLSATPDRVLMHTPVPLPHKSRGFAHRALPDSFVSSGQADSELRPTRAGLRVVLNLRFYAGPAWSLVPTIRPSECLQVGDGCVSPTGACCLLKRWCSHFRGTGPTAPGIGVGAPHRTPDRHGDEPGRGYARVMFRPD